MSTQRSFPVPDAVINALTAKNGPWNVATFDSKTCLQEQLQARLRNLGITTIPPLEELIGCHWFDFATYLVPMLISGRWSWEDYGSRWVMDHVLPLKAFDLHNREELQACFHYKNLRPMSPAANAKKNGRFDPVERDVYLEEFSL